MKTSFGVRMAYSEQRQVFGYRRNQLLLMDSLPWDSESKMVKCRNFEKKVGSAQRIASNENGGVRQLC